MPARTKTAVARVPSARKAATAAAPKPEPKAAKAAEKPAKAKSAAAAKTGTTKAKPAAAEKAVAAKAKPAAVASKKRKADQDEEDTTTEPQVKEETRQLKKTKIEAIPSRPKAKKPTHVAIGRKINDAPIEALDVYVFGEGTSGELGLGSKRVNGKKPIDVKRPRLNDNLPAKTVGVVQVACGGMHAVALTRDHKIFTWGVNDQGALGRDTAWDGGLRDVDKDEGSDSEDEDDTGLNPRESTPATVSEEHFAPGTKFVQVVASDSATFALTEDGRVYGWGTFRSSDGILGFTENIRVQSTPMLLPLLKNIKALAAGSNHILALDLKGNVLAWGCGQQNQLGRRIIERNKLSSLIPQGIGLPRGKTVKIACGAYHSFAIDKDGRVWGWGLNNFGEIGSQGNAGEDDAVILKPVKLTALEDHKITDVDGGVHHSLACSDKGELFTWGRVDGYQVGFEPEELDSEDVIFDEREKPRILVKPTLHKGVSNAVSVTAGTDNSFAVTKDGKVFSWGFSANYQTGQGTIEDIHVPTVIDNTAIREKKIVSAHAGGQFSIVVGVHEEPKTNGVNGQ